MNEKLGVSHSQDKEVQILKLSGESSIQYQHQHPHIGGSISLGTVGHALHREREREREDGNGSLSISRHSSRSSSMEGPRYESGVKLETASQGSTFAQNYNFNVTGVQVSSS
jgi:hypothetical protein